MLLEVYGIFLNQRQHRIEFLAVFVGGDGRAAVASDVDEAGASHVAAPL